jgi:hypothetical protein
MVAPSVSEILVEAFSNARRVGNEDEIGNAWIPYVQGIVLRVKEGTEYLLFTPQHACAMRTHTQICTILGNLGHMVTLFMSTKCGSW